MASSSSSYSSSRNSRYDVFVSFRGEDVRQNFLSHFLKELDGKLITTFKDMEIKKGESLDPVLKQAIKDSRIAVVLFSENYASSGWCLNELLEIVKCQKEFGQRVIPIFYGVDPSHVRKQTSNFGKVFQKTCNGKPKEVKNQWKKTLTEVANLVGSHIKDGDAEANWIEVIANNLLGELTSNLSTGFEKFVGIEGHIAELSTMLKLKSQEVRMVGIWGPSGIGKTTIGRALFSQLSRNFQSRIFIDKHFISTSNKDYTTGNPIDCSMKLHLQESFLSKLLGKPGIEVDNLDAVKWKLKHHKVLIIIDDLDDKDVLEALAGGDEWFGPGSRIISITTDMQILRGHGIKYVYKLGTPSSDLALQILCRSAFKQNSPPDDFKELASQVVVRVGGLPLALNVLGSSLFGLKKTFWVDTLQTLGKGLDRKIEKALSMSYERLERKEHKALFRHIACFFSGDEINYIKLMLADSELNVNTGLEILVDKSLIHVIPSWNNTNIVEMHCLVQEMGKEIVRTQSDKLGEREFLMDSKDVCNVLKGSTGTEKVLGISLDLDEIDEMTIDENAFKGMSRLCFLKFYKKSLEQKKEVRWKLPERLNDFPNTLKLLSWPGYPMSNMPSKFSPKYLIELRMPNSKLKELWKGVEPLACLKVMDLSESENLKEIPDLSEAINLETLNLHGCSSLVEIPSSIKNLKKLTLLNMAGCTKLEALPNGTNLQSLTRLILTGCSKLKVFPNISSKIESLIANKTAFQIFPSELRLENLVELRMEQITSERLWEGVQPLTSLTKLVLLGSKNLKEIPDLSMATSLKTLNLNGCSSIAELALSSIQNLNKLTTLEMIGCSSLETLPTGINLKSLYALDLKGCTQLRSFPDISSSISVLNLSQTAIIEVPRRIENFSSLESLEMLDCKNLETLPNGINLKSLYRLNLSGCLRLRSFPDISDNIASLYLNKTAIEEIPPRINKFSTLEALEMCKCKELKRISSRLFKHVNLDEVFISESEHLIEIRWSEEAEDTNNTSTKFSLISFTNCSFNLNLETFIQQSTSKCLILPGEMLPYFTHQSAYGSLIIPLHYSSLPQQVFLDFKACLVVSKGSETKPCYVDIEVKCRFRDKDGNYSESPKQEFSIHQKYNHQIIFDCRFPLNLECDQYSEKKIECDQVEITFYLPSTEQSELKLNRCGVRLLDIVCAPFSATQHEADESIADSDGNYMTAQGRAISLEGHKFYKFLSTTFIIWFLILIIWFIMLNPLVACFNIYSL